MLTEEERKCNVVLDATHPEVLNHAFNFRIPNIGPIDMGHQIEQLLTTVY
jgi:hypothetical protein